MRAARIALAILAGAFVAGEALLGQSSSGAVYGRVTDEHGSAVPGGQVILSGPAGPRATETDGGGFFRFLAVPPATYTVEITAPGFEPAVRERIAVSAGRNADLTFHLRLAGIEAELTVSGEAPLVDLRKVATGENFSGAALTEIPTSRDLWALAQQVP